MLVLEMSYESEVNTAHVLKAHIL